jgi:hypothetical protein
MRPRFPLSDVLIREVTNTRTVGNPSYADNYWQMNQNEFALQISGVGDFYACYGNEVEFSLVKGTSKAVIELYLNGSVYGAILHQRMIMPLHASSFVFKNQGVILCGESGVGKSSLTTAFCQNGAQFLTDDVTPIVFKDGIPYIQALSDRIKLWDNTLEQLKLEKDGLEIIEQDPGKFYYPYISEKFNAFTLDILFVIEIYEKRKVEFKELKGADKFAALRNEIYRWEYLIAMPETEHKYMQQLLYVARHSMVIKVLRPVNIPISEFQSSLSIYLAGTQNALFK